MAMLNNQRVHGHDDESWGTWGTGVQFETNHPGWFFMKKTLAVNPLLSFRFGQPLPQFLRQNHLERESCLENKHHCRIELMVSHFNRGKSTMLMTGDSRNTHPGRGPLSHHSGMINVFPWVTKELAYAYRHRVWSWLSSSVVGLIPSTGQMKETGPTKHPGPACPCDDTLRFCRTCSCASSGLRNFGMKAMGKTDMENEVWNHPKLRRLEAKGKGAKASWARRDVWWEKRWHDLLSVIFGLEISYHSVLLTC